MDTVFLVGIVLTLVVFAGVGVHAVVMDVYQIWEARGGGYSAVDDRVRRAVRVLEKECLDFDEERGRRVGEVISAVHGGALQDGGAMSSLSSSS